MYGDTFPAIPILTLSGHRLRRAKGMNIVQLPVGKLTGSAERMAFRQGLSRLSGSRTSLRVVSVGRQSGLLRRVRRADRVRCGAAGGGDLLQRRMLAGG